MAGKARASLPSRPCPSSNTGSVTGDQGHRFGKRVAMHRPRQPEEIAPAFVFLAAPSDSSYITGEITTIYGDASAN